MLVYASYYIPSGFEAISQIIHYVVFPFLWFVAGIFCIATLISKRKNLTKDVIFKAFTPLLFVGLLYIISPKPLYQIIDPGMWVYNAKPQKCSCIGYESGNPGSNEYYCYGVPIACYEVPCAGFRCPPKGYITPTPVQQ